VAGRPDKFKTILIVAVGAVAVLLAAVAIIHFWVRPGVRSVPVTLATSTGTLYGTLLLPARWPPWPAALIIAGSGPTDRDGNSRLLRGKNNSLKMLAQSLAARGIASLRYDKRGVGRSRSAGRRESDLRFDRFVADAAAWVRRLKGDRRFSRVVIVGHSQGSLVGMLAAARAGADGFVSLAGAGRPAWQILMDQLRPKVSLDRLAVITIVMDDLRRGRASIVPKKYPGLAALFRPSIQPFLIGWFKYDPARELARLTVPILILGGTTDIQVPASEARILARANPRARLKIIKGLNHVLKAVPPDMTRQLRSYGDPSLPLAPGLVEAIVGLVNGLR
jgi:pimeloyl-ACP methyl ester carboxylesterase